MVEPQDAEQCERLPKYGLLLFAIAAGVLIGIPFLFQSMSYDEAYTFLSFVNADLSQAFNYTEPNNHVLHTLLVRLSAWLISAKPWALRLPALLAGVACIPLSYIAARELLGRTFGFWTAMGVALCPALIEYSVHSRGYALMVALCLLSTICAVRLTKHLTRRHALLLGLSGALSLYAVPTALFHLAGIYLWLLAALFWQGRPRREILVTVVLIGGGITVVFTAIFYAPVVWISGGLDPIVNNRFVVSSPIGEFLGGLGGHVGQSFPELFLGLPVGAALAAILLLGLGLRTAHGKKHRAVLAFLPALLLGGAIVLLAKRRIP